MQINNNDPNENIELKLTRILDYDINFLHEE